jgi:teichoic acid transport system permease protein
VNATTSAATPSELAARHGLVPSSARPPLTRYVRALWQRRHFIVAFATSRTVSMYSGARLGQLWQVLTPLLNAAVYYFVFGILFDTQRGIENFEAFLVTGVFVFTFTQRSVTAGARAISGNLSLIRALHFPRAALPLASTIVELQQLLVSMVVLCVIVLLTGEPLTWRWLLVVPALVLQTMFNTGLALTIARVGARMPDVTQLLPFVTRTWLYLSGVLYSIPDRLSPGPLRDLMLANPAAVYIELARDGLMGSHAAPASTWYLAIGWAAVTLVGGFLYFWAAEERYGRG